MFNRLIACTLLGSLALACSSKDDHSDDEGNPALADVVYVGSASDEALSVMLALTAKDVASQHVTFTAPAANASLSKGTPIAISFQAPSARLERIPEPAHFPAIGAKQRLLWDLKSLLHPIGVAHAHVPPFNGNGYFLVFADAAKKTPLRVFTDQTSYTPDATQWGALAAGTQPITLSVTSAVFDENTVPSDGGPYVGGSVSFSID